MRAGRPYLATNFARASFTTSGVISASALYPSA